ncbi:MAG: nucleotidyltransferase family protein [Armatimonadetes bacterium]|nr:nucleotidyltransferase family protein [Armatimonadota bacterium]
MERVEALVLAAGTSSRMGQNKLLLPWDGSSVVGSLVTTLKAVGLAPLVVTGHESEKVTAAVAGARTVFNPNYRDGMGHSIAAGVCALSEADGVLIVLGDMPGLRIDVLKLILSEGARYSGNHIVRPSYENDTEGHPVLFGSEHFPALSVLTGDIGAKAIVDSNRDRLVLLPVGGRYDDIDTEADFRVEKESKGRD